MGALRTAGVAGFRRGLPRYWCWFQLVEAATHRVEHEFTLAPMAGRPRGGGGADWGDMNARSLGLARECPAKLTHTVQAQPPCEPGSEVELAALADG